MGDTEEAKEWRGLVALRFLFDRKKTINEKKRVAEACRGGSPEEEERDSR